MAIGINDPSSSSKKPNRLSNGKQTNTCNCSTDKNGINKESSGSLSTTDDIDAPSKPNYQPSIYRTLSWYKNKSASKPYRGISAASVSSNITTITTASKAFERKNPGCGLLNFYVLRILFWDIVVSGGDVVTDFMRVSKSKAQYLLLHYICLLKAIF